MQDTASRASSALRVGTRRERAPARPTLLLACVLSSCATSLPAPPAPGSFEVRPTPAEWAPYVKRIEVFGVPVIATAEVPEAKLLHVAVTLAEYLDNDEDARADDPRVLAALHEASAFLFMARSWRRVPDPPRVLMDGFPQYQGADETFPPGDPPPPEEIDVTLEEVWHLASLGWALAYPDAFGFDESPASRLTRAMDTARGGHFPELPRAYPEEAWYHYDDRTCDYGCMAAEYWGRPLRPGAHGGGRLYPERSLLLP